MTSVVRVAMIGLLGLVGAAGVPLAAQTNLTAIATAPTTVALTWAAAANTEGYRVQRALATGSFATVSPGKISGTTYTDAAAPAATALRYRIVATYKSGPNTFSNKVNVNTPAAGVTAVPVAVALVPVTLEPVSVSPASPPPGQPTAAPAVSKAAAAGALQPIAVQPLPERLSRTPMTAGPAPENLWVQSQGPIAHTVTWDPVREASGYLVAFTGKTGGQFLTLTPQPIPQPSFDLLAEAAPPAGIGTYREAPREIFVPSFQHDAFVTSGGTYRVTALYQDGRQGSADFVYANPPEGKVPTGFSLKKTGPRQVALRWNRVDFAKAYRIFGTGQPGDGLVVSTVGTTFSNLPYGSYSWQVTADYGGVYQTAGLPTAQITLAPPIVGFADTHTHPFANYASGGRMFWGEAFGPIEAVLSICDQWHGSGGVNDVVGNLKRAFSNNISIGHNTRGYPTFDGWPSFHTLTHQQMHSDWIQRAYQGGLRLMVSHAVNNGTLCELAARAPGRSCGDMEAADLQIDAAKNMEHYTDMQSGGPGKGWFRIAYSPADARKIIADGKLAVVLGIEVDKLFGCGKNECDAALVDAQLTKYYQKGVRHLIPVHFADNAFGGYALGGGTEKFLFGVNSQATNQGGLLSFTPPQEEDCSSRFAEKCNQRGLMPLGTHLMNAMMNKGMIIDIDHMGMKTTDAVLALTSARQYPVISGHTGFVATATDGHSSERDKSPAWLATMKQHGGMVSVGLAPGDSKGFTAPGGTHVPNDCNRSSKSMAQSYLYAVHAMGGPDSAAVAIASDQFLNELLGPRFDGHCPIPQHNIVTYPIAVRTGGQLQQSQAGNPPRVFNYNTEGLAHFGLLPEMIQDLKNIGLTERDLDPLFRSAEGYIQLWERAVASVPVP